VGGKSIAEDLETRHAASLHSFGEFSLLSKNFPAKFADARNFSSSFASRKRYAAIVDSTCSFALSRLLGARVADPSGVVAGKIREVALRPQEDPNRVSGIVVKTSHGDRFLLPSMIKITDNLQVHASLPISEWPQVSTLEDFVLLERDLLDQQIIDVHGRKVVRVNDVDLCPQPHNGGVEIKIGEVDVGMRGAVRRVLKGLAPSNTVEALVKKLKPRVIPWEFVDLIETDPARRVKLRIEHDRLSQLHPADIADIIEDLAPAERDAVFQTLDEEVAAEALEEIDPDIQVSLVESLDSERAADIVEEMDPDAAADLLDQLPTERSEEILHEMEPEEREEVEDLLEHGEKTAAGRMTTEYLAAPPETKARDAIDLLRTFEGGVESVATIYLVDAEGKLCGSVPLQRVVLANPEMPISELTAKPLVFVRENDKQNKVAELMDKYNLYTLAVVDEQQRLKGIITADDVITLLREQS
jgi:CBS domain-containing protein/sporulation protein YlmC with PRC-barrel domain